MSSANIGWLFYKDYFKGIDYSRLDDVNNEKLIQKKVQNIIDSKPTLNEPEIIGSTRFQATTTYPGLILGSGNAHEIPDVKYQAILGFHFDYTSGLPVIAGSSVKGVLRSAFKHKEYIEEYVSADVEALEKEIFDNGDIFFDAEIIQADGFEKIMGDDYITPHNDPLKDPIPLRFIKVLPNVTFLFQFELCDGILSKSEKETLFRKILEDLGLGAKTNVGYGKFKVSNAPKTEEELEAEQIAKELEEAKKKADKESDDKRLKEAKETKKQDGLSVLLECATLADGFKLLKDSFGKHPKPSNEEKEIIQKYHNKQKSLSKADKKVFSKYGIN